MIALPIGTFSDSQFWLVAVLPKHLRKLETSGSPLTSPLLPPQLSYICAASDILLDCNPSSPSQLPLPWPPSSSLPSPAGLLHPASLLYSPAGNYLTKSESFCVIPRLKISFGLRGWLGLESSFKAFLSPNQPTVILSLTSCPSWKTTASAQPAQPTSDLHAPSWTSICVAPHCLKCLLCHLESRGHKSGRPTNRFWPAEHFVWPTQVSKRADVYP